MGLCNEVNAVQTTEKGKKNRYILSGDLLAGRVTTTIAADWSETIAKSWYHLDHLNSTKVVTDETGAVEVNYTYRAFGEQLKRLDGSSNEVGDLAGYSYGGKELDDTTNLYYFNARYYDATTGRFINVDPIQDGSNWYVYCSNNPLSFVDPTGLWTFEAQLALGPGLKIEFGKNDGVFTFGFDVGFGIAAGVSLDLEDNEMDKSDLGTYLSVKVEGKMEIGEASFDSKVEATVNQDLSIENTSEANFSYTDPMTRVNGEITIDTEGIESDYDIDASFDGGLGGGVFMGVGVETSIEVDE